MSKVGSPIRKSSDQRLFAPSRSLSQRTTSFIASYRQGIHQMPLSHLITLISNAHHATNPNTNPSAKKECQNWRALYPAWMLCGHQHQITGVDACGHPKRQLNCAHCLRKTRSISDSSKTVKNRSEVNQTKPKHSARAEDLCR